ncbi:DNA replication/repair protein RecF [Clostridium sp. SYSU_GA19001]|uniref:DNA replication/repair protein RecF n=1 Tax=Clostridium caldaquaticum TaxID=2940653 RepID=UPI0020770DFD|nr:DNA replication/repair protein RecF [Clostridium caldaquaticum]MCM8711921.1 DNA replication/repair protein RecF [Clostridium caldaquaticum]
MYIKNLQLMNFRNYEELNISFNNGVNIFIGDNAQGKTNILESIYYCSLAKSHRTNKDKELISWNKEDTYIKAYISKQRLDKVIEMKIFKDGKKGIRINTIKINKIQELIGIFNVVLFSPEDLKIVKESPSHRRKFLDMEICKLNPKYYYSLVQYNKALNERNSLLKKWSDDMEGIIEVYDAQLSKYGSYIINERIRYIDLLNKKGKIIHREITSETEEINFKYITSLKNTENIASELNNLLKKNIKSDIERRTTSYGPHRDDFSININGVDTRNFGSQGQQRTSVLTIKFSSLEIIKDETNEYPVLLLDDVLSELDLNRQKYILNSINNVQTIITCTGIENIKNYLDKSAKVFIIKGGKVIKEYLLNQS